MHQKIYMEFEMLVLIDYSTTVIAENWNHDDKKMKDPELSHILLSSFAHG